MKNKVYLHTCMCIIHELAALYIAQYTYVAMCRHMKQVMSLELLCMKGERDIALLFHKSFIHVRYYILYAPTLGVHSYSGCGHYCMLFCILGCNVYSSESVIARQLATTFESGLHCGLGTLLFRLSRANC